VNTARNPAFVAALRGVVRGEVRTDESLARYSTYRIGGPATVLLPAVNEDVGVALRMATAAGVPWFAVGLGSNILLPDEGMDALVIRLGKGLDRLDRDGDRWTVGAGLPAPLAARRTAAGGWFGLHKFVGVPGTAGGGVYMNASCHGTDGRFVDRFWWWTRRGRAPCAPAPDPVHIAKAGLIGRWCSGRRPSERPAVIEAEVPEDIPVAFRGNAVQPACCGSVFRNRWRSGTGGGPESGR
jgi:hypothetical protein